MDGFFWTILAFVLGYMLGRNSMKGDAGGSPGGGVAVGDLSAVARHEMEEALRRGEKIEAIRIVREDSGADLKRSKAFVEAFADRHERRPGDPIN